MKKVLAICIALIMVINISFMSGAASSTETVDTVSYNNVTYKITTTETNNIKTVKVEEGDTLSTVSYNKTVDKINVDVYKPSIKKHTKFNYANAHNTKIKYPQTQYPSTYSTPSLSLGVSSSKTIGASYGKVIISKSDLLLNYSYSCTQYNSMYMWSLRAGSTPKSRYEVSSNQSDIFGFKQSVDNLTLYEAGAIAGLGVGATGVIVGILTAPTGLGAIIGIVLALGGSITTAYTLYQACASKDNADFYFARIL